MDFQKIKSASILALAIELLSETSIIKLPKSAKYSLIDTLTVLLHAATSISSSSESACNDLKLNNPDKKIPSSDTVNAYIKSNSIEHVLSSFRKINRNIVKTMNLRNTTHDIAIDFHDIPFYGDKNTSGVRGIKAKNGTSWGYSFCTIDLIGNIKLTLDVIDINGLTKNYKVLIQSMLERVEKTGVNIGTLFMDREFFHIEPISVAQKLNVKFVIAAKSNAKINKILDEHKKTFGRTSTIFKYNFNKGGPTFYIVAVVNPKYDPTKKIDKGNREFYLFATNLKFSSISEFIAIVPEEYRKRWNIETGYRVKNVFKIRTCSKSPVVRTLYFVIQCILYNVLNMLKSGLDITAYQLKSVMNSDIVKCVKSGYESLFAVPVKTFLMTIKEFNENRIEMLRARLKET
ncbi:MAG: ISH3 family transposase [Methanosarcinaceae archaeon]